MHEVERIKLLIKLYLGGDLSIHQEIEFNTWLSASVENKKLLESFTDDILFEEQLKDYLKSTKMAESLRVPDVTN